MICHGLDFSLGHKISGPNPKFSPQYVNTMIIGFSKQGHLETTMAVAYSVTFLDSRCPNGDLFSR